MLTSPPNLLTVSRILAVPALVAAFYLPGHWAPWVTCFVFSAAAVTDYLDGYLARSMALHSKLGRCFDPIADKLLVGAAILMLVAHDRAPLFPSLIILCREIVVSGLREFLAELSVGLPVSRLAKWKTGVQMAAIAFLLLGASGPLWLPVAEIGWYGLWLAALLTLVTGYDYLYAAVRHFEAEEDEAPRPMPGKAPPGAVGTARLAAARAKAENVR
jgi:cardiolipin synthase